MEQKHKLLSYQIATGKDGGFVVYDNYMEGAQFASNDVDLALNYIRDKLVPPKVPDDIPF